MEQLTKYILIFTVLLSGLTAGLLYGYTCSVSPGLRQLNDNAYLSAMQSINKAILNPVFFLSFAGALIGFVFCALLLGQINSNAFILILIAVMLYGVGVWGVTLWGNVPLNERLAAFNIEAANVNELRNMRQLFEKPWNRFHLLRTAASVLSFLLSIIAYREL